MQRSLSLDFLLSRANLCDCTMGNWMFAMRRPEPQSCTILEALGSRHGVHRLCSDKVH